MVASGHLARILLLSQLTRPLAHQDQSRSSRYHILRVASHMRVVDAAY